MEKKSQTLRKVGRNLQTQSRTDAETSRRANDIFSELGKLHLAGKKWHPNLRLKEMKKEIKDLV